MLIFKYNKFAFQSMPDHPPAGQYNALLLRWPWPWPWYTNLIWMNPRLYQKWTLEVKTYRS